MITFRMHKRDQGVGVKLCLYDDITGEERYVATFANDLTMEKVRDSLMNTYYQREQLWDACEPKR